MGITLARAAYDQIGPKERNASCDTTNVDQDLVCGAVLFPVRTTSYITVLGGSGCMMMR